MPDLTSLNEPAADKSSNFIGEERLSTPPAWISIIAISLLALLVILPIAFLGIPDGFDLLQHVRFASAYRDSWLSGEMIPGWSANDNFGFGSIGIRYYPPLAHFVLAAAWFVTGSWFHSFWITSFLWMALGSIGIYFWVREWQSGLAAILAAFFYILAPYHTFQIYQAILYAEFAAAGLLPFCFFFLTRVFRRRGWIDTVYFAIAFSLLVLTHIPSAMIGALSLAIYGLMILPWKEWKSIGIKAGTASFLALSATGFHMVKVVTELDWVRHNSSEFYTTGFYNYQSYFFPIYYSAPWIRYVQRLLWLTDIMIVLTLLFFVPLLIFAVRRWKIQKEIGQEARQDRALLVTGLFAFFMLSVGSIFIWNLIPTLQKIQFPWRWLLTMSIAASAAFGIGISRLWVNLKRTSRTAVYSVILLTFVVILYDLTQNVILSAPLPREVFEQRVSTMNSEPGCDCWWPVWAQESAFDRKERLDAGQRQAVVNSWDRESRSFTIDAGGAEQMRVATFFHPYWSATVNGIAVVLAYDKDGAILVPLTTEIADVKLTFSEPTYLYIAKVVSSFTWLLFAILVTTYIVKNYKERDGNS